ncbi:MAG: BTAD domain-containing putative transcriptional regulator [Streptosporangiaceae bacterium]
MNSAALGDVLRKRRRMAGITQRDLADRAGVPLGTVRDIEQGRTGQPQDKTVHRLARTLGMDPAEIAADVSSDEHGLAARPLWVRVLGPVTVFRRGSPVRLGPPQQKAVFAMLALRPNRPVHREEIIDCLWPQSPPRTSVNMVQTYVMKLRRNLSPGRRVSDSGELLGIVGPTYRLRLESDTLDLLAFEEGHARAQERLGAGEAGQACDLFAEALSLWQDRPACDVDSLRQHPTVLGPARSWAEATVGYAEAALASGRPEESLQHLWELCSREPLDERAHIGLMRVLSATNQHATALRVFEDLRVRLDQTLGAVPGRELTVTHQRVLQHDPVLNAESRTEAGGQGGRGWTPICQLPPDVADFTGREEECQNLAAMLSSPEVAIAPQIAIVSGPPGAGKSTLALHLAHLLRGRFPDGQFFVQLSGASRPRDPADVLGELLRTLELPPGSIPQALDERAALLRARLADRRVLLLLDDAASVDQLLPLLLSTPGCAVLVTSRIRLTGLAGARLLPIESMDETDAIQMLTQIIGAERVTAELEEATLLTRFCGLLPLAIRIAGARLAAQPAWKLSRFNTLLRDRGQRLDTLKIDHLEVRASIASSYEALEPDARAALGFLCLLGPHDVADWVFAPLTGDPGHADLLDTLVRRSLLTPAGSDVTGEPRYRLHDLVRDFATEASAAIPESVSCEVVRRVGLAYLELADRAAAALPREPHFPVPTSRLDVRAGLLPEQLAARLTAEPTAWFAAERLLLLAIIRWAVSARDLRLAERLAEAHLSYHHVQARFGDMAEIWKLLLEAAREQGDRGLAARALHRLAAATSWAGGDTEALAMLDDCIAQLDELSDFPNLRLALAWRGYSANMLGDFDDALVHSTRGLLIARAQGDRMAEIMNLRMVGFALANKDDPAGLALCVEAVDLAEALDQPLSLYLAYNSAAWTAARLGEHGQAAAYCRRGLTVISRACLHPTTAAYFLSLLGDCHNADKEHEEAIRAFDTARMMFEERGDRRALAHCLLKLGRAHQQLGRPAAAYLEQSRTLFSDLGLDAMVHQAEQAQNQ